MKQNQKGKFIVLEGLEGSGKTTACNVVKLLLKEQGIKNFILTREPGSTPLAEFLRKLLKYRNINQEHINNKTELLLIYAARVQLVETVIKPALNRGEWVIGDRHSLSSQAYQGGGRNLSQHLIKTLHNIILKDFYPDITLYLDVTPEISLKRISKRQNLDSIERESLLFFQKVRDCYLTKLSKNQSIYFIDAMQPIKCVHLLIKQILLKWMSEKYL